MNINYQPRIRTQSYITVKCVDEKERIVDWETYDVPQKDLLEIEKLIEDGTCMNKLSIGNERIVRWVCEPHIVGMFCRIAWVLGDACFKDTYFEQKMLEEASRAAKEYDGNNRWANSRRWLKGAKASIRNYKRYGNEYELIYKYAEIIHYFRLFDIVGIDLFICPEDEKKVTYKITTTNGGSINLIVDYRGSSENQMKEIDEYLRVYPIGEYVAKEVHYATLGNFKRIINEGIVENLCCEKKEFPYVNNYNTEFTRELVLESVKNNQCATERANEILTAIEETENLTYHKYYDKAYELLVDFFYDIHPYKIERID